MHTRSTSQKKMLEAMASAKCWRSWNGKEKLQVHVSTWVLTCTYTSSYHSQLVMLCSERTVYWSGNQKGDRVHGLTLRVGLQFLRGKIVFDFCHFVLQKPGSIYIYQAAILLLIMYFQISQSNYSDLRQLSEMSKPANLSKLNYTCQFAGWLISNSCWATRVW